MPLPPALAARLAKRGIIKDSSVAGYDPQLGRVADKGRDEFSSSGRAAREEQLNSSNTVEEVFAEDYDDVGDIPPPGQGPPAKSMLSTSSVPETDNAAVTNAGSNSNLLDKTKYIGHAGCPNKWNIHHECVLFCRSYWGNGNKEPTDTEYIRVHNIMIDKFHPLPDGWREMYDPGTARHYYWCTKTDKVSWLPPGHPRAKATEAASKIRQLFAAEASLRQKEEEDKMSLDSDMEYSDEEDEEDRRLEEQRRKEKEKRKEEEKRLKEKKRRKEKDLESEALDPMDPAAYSDIARGTWSAGLPDQSTAKSGVDSTASGPLFQQRPYPNPGAVLRANAAARDEEDEDEDGVPAPFAVQKN